MIQAPKTAANGKVRKKARIIPEDVKPTQTMLITPCPCERKAATIRNQTLAEMRKNNIGNVAYYLLKCKNGILDLWLTIGFFAVIFAGLIYYEIIKRWLNPISVLLHLGGLCLMFGVYFKIQFNNLFRYKTTQNDCTEWLKEELDCETFNKIKGLSHYQHNELHKILSENGLEATLLYSDPYRPISKTIAPLNCSTSHTSAPSQAKQSVLGKHRMTLRSH